MTDQFCTYFDHRYAAKGLTMWRSLKKHRTTAVLHVLCLNNACHDILEGLQLPDVRLHSLSVLERADPGLARVRGNRTLVEYYFTTTPCFPRYLLKTRSGIARLTYVDADLFFFADPQPVFDEIGDDAIGLIEHRFPAELSDRRKYGRFNVGWLTFRNDPVALECLDVWREQCLEWCYDRLEPGRFAEQKYLDEWPDRYERLRIVQHPGANLAPWNLNRFEVSKRRTSVSVDGQPLLFYHAHGFEPAGAGHQRRLNLAEYNVPESDLLLRTIFDPYERALIASTKEIALPLVLALGADRSRETTWLLETLKARVSLLEQEVSARNADLAARDSAVHELQRHVSDLGDLIAALRAHLSTLQTDVASRADTIAELQANYAALQAESTTRAVELGAMQARLASSEADRATQANKIRSMQAALEQAESVRLAQLSTIQLFQAQRDNAMSTIEDERSRRRQVEEHLALIFRSSSWRWTSALRWIRDGLRGGPRTR